MAQRTVMSCEICESSPGNRFCMDCEQFFCNSCEISHLKTKPCRNHVFQDAENANAEVKTPICEHHGEKFTYYCNTCTLLTCNICLPKAHQKHDFCLIDDAASKKRLHLDCEVQKATKSIELARMKIGFSQDTLQRFEYGAKRAKNDIVKRVNVIVNAFNDKKDTYLKSIDEHKMEESRMMNEAILDMVNARDNCQTVLSKMVSSMNEKNYTTLLDSFSDMIKTLKSISKVCTDIKLPVCVQFLPASGKPDVEKMIGNISFSKIQKGDKVRLKHGVHRPDISDEDIDYYFTFKFPDIGTISNVQGTTVTVYFFSNSEGNYSLSDLELL